MGLKKNDSDDIPIQQIQQKAKKFLFLASNCYLKICQQLNTNFFYLLTIIQTLQILWFSFHPQLKFLKQPLLLDYIRQILSYTSFENLVLQNPSSLSTFLIISFLLVTLSIITLCISIMFIMKNKDSQISKVVHKIATIQFLLNNTAFTIPFVGISAMTLYCAADSPYHIGRKCYDIQHLIYCVMAALIVMVIIIQSLVFWFIFYIKNPFSRCFLANPDNLWKIAKVLVKTAPSIYFAVDYSNSLQNVYVFAYLILNGGYFFFFRFLSLTWFNKKHLYFCMVLQSIITWFAAFNVINYYLNKTQVGSLALIQAILVCFLVIYLIYTVQRAISQQVFIENLKSSKIKKQNVERFFYILIDMLFNYSKDTKNMLLVAVKLLNSKNQTCNIRVAQLFKNRQLKPEQELAILYQFFILQCDNLLLQNPGINILKVIKSHLLFKIDKKIQSIHDIVQLQHQKLSFAQQFMIYQFKQSYDIFAQNYEKEVHQQNNLVIVYFSFNNKMNQFQSLIKDCTENNKQYWQELSEDNPSLIKLRDLSSCYSKIMEDVKKVFSELSVIFPNNLKSIYFYQKFLLYVGIDSKQLMKLRQKMELQTSLISDQSQGMEENLIKFRQNDNLCVISIDTIESSFGVISDCNNQSKKYLGYTKKELIGSKVAKIMPKIFNQIHDNFIRNFILKQDSAVYPSQKVVYAINKEGLLIQTALYIKIVPNEDKAFQIVGFLRPIRYIDRSPAIAFASMNSKTIQGVNQSFINFVNRPLDFANIAKQPIPISTFLPNFEFKLNMKPGQQFQTQLTYNNSSDRMLQLNEQDSKQPSRKVNIKIIQVKIYQNIPLAFFEIQESNKDQTQLFGQNNSQLYKLNQRKSSKQIKKQITSQVMSLKQVINSTQFLQELPIERKMQQFVNSNNKNSQFICMKLLIVIFTVITICGSVAMYGINKIFQNQVRQIFKATNLTMSIAALTGRITLLSTKSLQTTSSTPMSQFTNLTSSLSINSEIMKQNLIDLIKIAYQYNYTLEVNQNNFYQFTILRQTDQTPRIKSNQSYVDGMFKFAGSGLNIANFLFSEFVNGYDELIETYWYTQINGRQLIPNVTLKTVDKFADFFHLIVQNQIATQIKYLAGKTALVIITFILLSVIMLKLNSFNQFTIELYNHIYLWDINQLIYKCSIFTKDYTDNDSINQSTKQIKNDKYRESNILSFFPKKLLIDIIQDKTIGIANQKFNNTCSVEDNNQENSLLDHQNQSPLKSSIKKKQKKKKVINQQFKGATETVTIQENYNLKKTLILILIIVFFLVGSVVGFYCWIQSTQKSIKQRQNFIEVLGKIRKNIQFIRYYSFQILINHYDNVLYRSFLSLQMANLHQNAAFFYTVIGDPNPILKSIYSQIEQIKSVIQIDSQTGTTISSIDPKYLSIQKVLQQNTIKLSQLTQNEFKNRQNQILQNLNTLKIIRIVADVIAALILIVFLDNCYISPLRKNVVDSINMIKMLPIWLVNKNKYIKGSINA